VPSEPAPHLASRGRPRAWLSWSSGKDCAFALAALRAAGDVDVVGLLTTVNGAVDRVTMHGVRRVLLEAQAEAVGLPLHIVTLGWPCSDEEYRHLMTEAMAAAVADGVTYIAFGDLFLADVRAYREERLAPTGITPLFPLWGRPTAALADQMIADGVRAVLTCVDPRKVPASFAGRWYDDGLLTELPDGVDPCGENGEFHTFVVDAPGFGRPLDVRVGDLVERDGFVFADVLPAD
jgi:uncharacterized protein (TIGR00290 family)